MSFPDAVSGMACTSREATGVPISPCRYVVTANFGVHRLHLFAGIVHMSDGVDDFSEATTLLSPHHGEGHPTVGMFAIRTALLGGSTTTRGFALQDDVSLVEEMLMMKQCTSAVVEPSPLTTENVGRLIRRVMEAWASNQMQQLVSTLSLDHSMIDPGRVASMTGAAEERWQGICRVAACIATCVPVFEDVAPLLAMSGIGTQQRRVRWAEFSSVHHRPSTFDELRLQDDDWELREGYPACDDADMQTLSFLEQAYHETLELLATSVGADDADEML